jgi:hypothetical protein
VVSQGLNSEYSERSRQELQVFDPASDAMYCHFWPCKTGPDSVWEGATQRQDYQGVGTTVGTTSPFYSTWKGKLIFKCNLDATIPKIFGGYRIREKRSGHLFFMLLTATVHLYYMENWIEAKSVCTWHSVLQKGSHVVYLGFQRLHLDSMHLILHVVSEREKTLNGS